MSELMTGKERSLQQEERIAKLFKGQTTPRSGGGPFKSGDVLSADFLVECKTTAKPSLSFSVNKAVLDKADHERAEMRKPFYALAFTLGEQYEDYFVLDRKTMQEFLSLREGIAQLVSEQEEALTVVQTKMSVLRAEGDVTDTQVALYAAHVSRIKNFLENLRKFS